MKTYYTTDSEGKITQSANWPFPGSRLTNKEIIRGHDGGLYFAGDEPTPPCPTPDEFKAQFDVAVTARLDTFARQRDWETIDRVLAQRGKFAGDAAIAQAAYDATWEAALTLFPQVQDGTLSVSDVLAQLPELSWSMPDKTEEPISMEESAPQAVV